MATHAKIAASLLRSAATFFRDIAGHNPAITDQMLKNADTYDAIAGLVETDPLGALRLPSDEDGEEPSAAPGA